MHDIKMVQEDENSNDISLVNGKYKTLKNIKLVLSVIVFLVLMALQTVNTNTMANGIYGQLQLMISICMVTFVPKKGYWLAMLLNVVLLIKVSVFVILTSSYSAVPGIVLPVCTVIVISILAIASRQINAKLIETAEQKAKLAALYEELSVAHKELYEQNQKMKQYNKSMEENGKKLNRLAYFDLLTELPNRVMILNRIDLLISLAQSAPMKFAVVFIDLDNFKKINDSLGHNTGDVFLMTAASKLRKLIDPADLLGRLGGDEFALIIQHHMSNEEILKYVTSLKNVISEPIVIDGNELKTSASFGISVYPEDGDNSQELLKCADTAMYKVKENGKNGIQFFSIEMKDAVLKRIEFENCLSAAIGSDEMYIVFQPQYNSQKKKLRGFEALVRWQSSKLGFVSPSQLIPVAEETGMIIPLGEWILKTACQRFMSIVGPYHNTMDAVLSVNISAVQVMNPDFVQMVKETLDETGFDPRHLELEVTESVFISSADYAARVLEEIKGLGIRIALDDFGTGYSSLSYLHKLPIDTLKIDKSFIDTLNAADEKQIVGSIITLVHQMNISVVAEGVENESQLDYLKTHDCDCIQGYLWGKPLKEEDIKKLVEKMG